MLPTFPGFPPAANDTNCRIISDPSLVTARLLELHPTLDNALLQDVTEHGYRARTEATDLHPTTAAGTFHWHAAVFAVRSMLTGRGWRPEDSRNCPFIVSPDRSIAICVMTGDSETGWINGNPSNQAEKGSVLEQAVIKNQKQLKLFDASIASRKLASSKEATQLWVFLYHVAIGSNGKTEIRAELSLPSHFERKRIINWHERLILAPIAPDGDVVIRGNAPSGPIDVPIERKIGT